MHDYFKALKIEHDANGQIVLIYYRLRIHSTLFYKFITVHQLHNT